jgi:xanthine dehydrogenase iron-sulfur cluster and FAD-binding subunit A
MLGGYVHTNNPAVSQQPSVLFLFLAAAERIAEFHGSQCGFCTPGFVVACHATLARAKEAGRVPSADEMQTGLDGNLCRCTGYRPILDACKVTLSLSSKPLIAFTSIPTLT